MKSFLCLLIALNLSLSEYELGLNLKVGETYFQNMTSELEIEQTIEGMTQKVTLNIFGNMGYRVTDYINSEYSMTVSFTQIGMNMITPEGTVIMSSENPSEDIFSSFMKNMLGREYNIKMNRNGTISEITNIDSLFSNLFNGVPKVSEEQKQLIVDQLKPAFGEKAFKGNTEMITAIFPSGKVSIGESWSNNIKLESRMSGNLQNTFTLTEWNSNEIIITGISEFSTVEETEDSQYLGLPSKYNLTGKFTSTHKLDPESNWILESTVEQNISGNIEVISSAFPEDWIIPMTIKSKMIISSE